MAVNRIERICGFCKYALPIAAVLYLSVNGISCDSVSVYHGDLIPACTHASIECRDDAIFDGTHDLIRVRHVVDRDVHFFPCKQCRGKFFGVSDAPCGRRSFPDKSCGSDKNRPVIRSSPFTAIERRHLTVLIVDASALYVPRCQRA